MAKRKGKRMNKVAALALERDENGVQIAVGTRDEGTPERHLKGDVQRSQAGTSGKGSKPARAMDLLEIWLRRGEITKPQFTAGDRFRDFYALSRLDPLHAPDVARIPGQAGGDEPDNVIDAKNRIFAAYNLLGGVGEMNSRAITYVIGEGYGIEAAAERYGNEISASVPHYRLKERVLAALAVLAANRW